MRSKTELCIIIYDHPVQRRASSLYDRQYCFASLGIFLRNVAEKRKWNQMRLETDANKMNNRIQL